MTRDGLPSLCGLAGLVLSAAVLATEPPGMTGAAASATGSDECAEPDCPPHPPQREISQAMQLARAALDRVVATYLVDRGRIRDLVRGSAGFAVLQDVVKMGFIFATIHGHGFLVYRQPDGRWGPPLMLEVYGTSVGPQVGSRISDVLVVFKDAESMQKLLKGELPHGLITPSGSLLYGATESGSAPPGIVTYSLHRGVVLGQSVDEYRLRLSEQDNLTLYGEPLKGGQLVDVKRFAPVMPAPVHLFVDYVNTQLGEPTHGTEWRTGAPAARP